MEKSPIFPVKGIIMIMMTFPVYLSQILDLYSFKPNTKYVEDILDTNCFQSRNYNGLLATGTINCEVCGQARGKNNKKINITLLFIRILIK